MNAVSDGVPDEQFRQRAVTSDDARGRLEFTPDDTPLAKRPILAETAWTGGAAHSAAECFKPDLVPTSYWFLGLSRNAVAKLTTTPATIRTKRAMYLMPSVKKRSWARE